MRGNVKVKQEIQTYHWCLSTSDENKQSRNDENTGKSLKMNQYKQLLSVLDLDGQEFVPYNNNNNYCYVSAHIHNISYPQVPRCYSKWVTVTDFIIWLAPWAARWTKSCAVIGCLGVQDVAVLPSHEEKSSLARISFAAA